MAVNPAGWKPSLEDKGVPLSHRRRYREVRDRQQAQPSPLRIKNIVMNGAPPHAPGANPGNDTKPGKRLGHGGSTHAPRDYGKVPLNVYWEMTQACALACRHCRAEAMPDPDPQQLSFPESLAFLDQILEFGEPLPHLILTGGDPLERRDLFPLIDAAVERGIGVSITPAATAALTKEVLQELCAHGIVGLGLSLDASTAERHDAIRGVEGTFSRTLQALAWAQELDIPVQVNSLVALETADDLPATFELLKKFGIARWSLFFLIAVGRGKVLRPLEAEAAEQLMRWVFRISRESSFIVATTEAPSYRRVALELMRAQGLGREAIGRSGVARGFGIRDGHGIVFVSNTGEICPAGFLPLSAGNVRTHRLAEVYREAPLFRRLHDSASFGGRCGACEYHALCGGSRARAFAATSSPFGEDPLCTFQPR
jgi:AdoMet-dependent heme synthase